MKTQFVLFLCAFGWLKCFANAAVDYDREIKPLLEEKCYRCHDGEKVKGDLRLDSPEGILAGGENGAILVPGKPNESSVFIMTTYPKEDPDYMPQKGKGLSKSEQTLLKSWIEEGALFGDGFAHKPNPAVKQKFEGADPDASRKYMIMGDALKVVTELRNSGLLVDTVNHDASLFEVSYTYAELETGQFNFTALVPLKDSLKKLSLARTRIRSEDLESLADLNSIEYLDLSRTEIDDDALEYVSRLKNLKTLNLRDTNISDSGLQKLEKLKGLERVYVWRTAVTPVGVKRLEKRVEGVSVNFGTPILAPNRGRRPQA